MTSHDSVCPARAGMIRGEPLPQLVQARLPRTRGDDPNQQLQAKAAQMFAPHARG